MKVAEEMTDFCVLNGDPTNPQSTGQTVHLRLVLYGITILDLERMLDH